MKTHSVSVVCGLLTVALFSGNALAQNRTHVRAKTSEFYLLLQDWSAEDLTLQNVTLPTNPGPTPLPVTSDLRFDLDSTVMWGFGGGYNFTDMLFLRGEITFGSPDYAMTWNNRKITGESWINKGNMNLDVNFLRNRPFSPFITGGIGYMYIDTGIPSGPAEYTVWWDYFWGPVLVGSQPSYSKTYFTYNAGAGLRWDLNDQMALRFVATYNWVDAKRDTIETVEATFAFSFRY